MDRAKATKKKSRSAKPKPKPKPPSPTTPTPTPSPSPVKTVKPKPKAASDPVQAHAHAHAHAHMRKPIAHRSASAKIIDNFNPYVPEVRQKLNAVEKDIIARIQAAAKMMQSQHKKLKNAKVHPYARSHSSSRLDRMERGL